MRILALDSSATSASVAIIEDEKIIGSFYIHTKFTHSQTLMPMVKDLLECTKIDIKNIDAFAVCVGPGSFTGIRIGVSAIKGMAMALDKPCLAVSTLEAMAYNLIGHNCTACSVMDARCNQVYNAFFKVEGNNVSRITPDSAVQINQLLELNGKNKIILVGDGAKICYNSLNSTFENIELAPEHLVYQNAVGVAQVGLNLYKSGNTISAEKLIPIYLRLPQAERELKKRLSLKREV